MLNLSDTAPLEIDHHSPPENAPQHQLKINIRVVFALFLASSAFTVLLTALPVVRSDTSGTDFNGPYPTWYGLNDLLRLLEPLISLPLQLWLLVESKCFLGPSNPIGVTLVFAFGLAMYQQGAGFHSAAVMFKKSTVTLKSLPAGSFSAAASQIIADTYSWERDMWEHNIAHYWYAFGAVVAAAALAWAYKDVELPDGIQNMIDRTLWILAIFFYGLCIGFVAIEFPCGTLVALLFLTLYGFGVVGSAVWRRGKLLSWGTAPVLQYFLFSYVFAFCITIGWLCYTKSLFINRSQA